MSTPRPPSPTPDPSPCPGCGLRASTLDALAAVCEVRPTLAHLSRLLRVAADRIRPETTLEGDPQ
ncbi:hypothetical protein M3G03_10170 [Aestuariimicrobium sp. p3-SID1156]|uniref:hypothetical protein n=1 Tax=Aestuariimicrobium sp. p3-SID1156 TaxID=2916038 RepID=UPI00223B9E0D|nr:hypothetical protein [Aestuariimicrobium sp. p3-SID1156]MCT1459896.1 hypothetical protein [Aestuariimicrobium sp. p3-SID1156]